jgi:hypothetical protein
LPGEPILEEATEPLLVRESHLEALRSFLASREVDVVEVDLAQTRDEVDVFATLKAELEFPTWCGAGWDSFADAFEEIRASWTFPLALIVHGSEKLLAARMHLALHTILGFDFARESFSRVGEQLLPIYVVGDSA